MGRQRNPDREKAMQMWLSSFPNTIKVKDIAIALGYPEATVRKWKSEDKWESERSEKRKRNVPKKRTEKSPSKRNAGGAPFGNQNAKGNSGGGAPIGNTNALKHGGYSRLFWDTLDEEEKQMLEELDFDGEQLLLDEISLLSVRERRIMASIAKHKSAKGGQAVSNIVRSEEKREFADEDEKTLYEERIAEKVSSGDRLPGRSYRLTTTTEATYDIIQRLEEALTRCQAQKQKCIESLNKLRIERGDDGKAAPENNLLQALLSATTEDIDTDDISELEQTSEHSNDMVE